MEVDTCLLCEAATVKEGLLYILGGGITHVPRESFPAPLGVSLALRIIGEPADAANPHTVEIVLRDDESEIEVTRVKLGIEVTEDPPADAPNAEILLAWGFPGQPVLPHEGRYTFDILIDAVRYKQVPVTAITIPGDG
jgi:Family of unknown function (DUF6941)